jgi:hypothetical protein
MTPAEGKGLLNFNPPPKHLHKPPTSLDREVPPSIGTRDGEAIGLRVEVKA